MCYSENRGYVHIRPHEVRGVAALNGPVRGATN